MKKIILSLMFVFSFILGYSQYDLSKNVDRQIIVVPKKGMELQTKNHFNNSDTKIVVELDQLGWYVVLIPEGLSQDEFIRQNQNLSFVQNLYKDETMEMKMDYIPNDVEFVSCWHLKQSTDKDIDADEAWDLVPADNPFVSVAMFDGGLDLTIPDLAGNTNSPFNAVNSTTSIPYVNSEDKHGTACSGTIAAVTNNGIGVSSVGNNKVKVMPVNIMSAVFAGGSFQTTSTIQINGINAAMANPTCVAIAMSYGGSSYSASLDAAFQTARTTARNGKGMVVVASSGNGSSGTASQYPANYPAVWGIGATSQSDVRASFSNFGQICDISAPGVGIRTTDRLGTAGYDPGDYRSVNGTSFSCPITAAAAAFVFYKNWELTDDQVLQILAQSAEKVGGYSYSNVTGWPLSTRSNELGYGRINLKDAINLTPNPGGVLPPDPPAQIHNFVINTLTVSPNSITVGSNITITATVATQNPTFPSVEVMTQHRLSTNTTWGDADDIIIGTTSGTLGGGVAIDVETITYNVGNITGVRYIISRANFMGSVPETNINDNTRQASFTVTQPIVSGGDLSIIQTLPTTSSVTISPTQTQLTLQWKVTNTGTVPITTFTWDRMWVTIPESPRTWPTTTSWQGPLLPGQFIYLPAGGMPTNRTAISYLSSSVCFNANSCALQPGSTNTFRIRILTVNGGAGDENLANNQVECTVTRLATAVNNDGVITDTPEVKFVEVRQFSNLYEKPIRYGSIDDAILEKGLNIIHIHYSDGTIEVRKISVN